MRGEEVGGEGSGGGGEGAAAREGEEERVCGERRGSEDAAFSGVGVGALDLEGWVRGYGNCGEPVGEFGGCGVEIHFEVVLVGEKLWETCAG